MTTVNEDIKEETPIRVRRGRVESVDLYEIKDSELDLLEEGSPADLQLNFAIFLFSCALSTLGSLITSTFPDSTTKTTYIVITVVGFVIGSYLALSWYRNRTSLKSICQRIRERIPPDVAKTPGEKSEPLDVEQSDAPKG